MNRPVRESAGDRIVGMSINSQMTSVVQNNPFRILGVYANASTKEIVGNIGKLKAFLKVHKEVSYFCDFNKILSPLERNIEMMSHAESQLTLAKDKIRHALFWFIKVTPLDDVAFNHLSIGDIEAAITFWDKTKCFSSLLNKATMALIQKNYPLAIDSMMTLLTTSAYRNDFVHNVADVTFQMSEEELVHSYLDIFIKKMGNDSLSLLPHINDSSYRNYIKSKLVSPIISNIEVEITKAKSIKRDDSKERYRVGLVLFNNTKTLLEQLNSLLTVTDLQYQIIADKLGIEILQCGIDYFNNSKESDAAYKAMKLQKYASSIVVSKIAKDRCEENLKILQEIIDNLPPLDILDEVTAITKELERFRTPQDSTNGTNFTEALEKLRVTRDLTRNAIILLNNCKPLLQTIKSKMGVSDSYYLKISTQVVGNALNNVIEEVNHSQYPFLGRSSIETVLGIAWNAIKIMDTFDMEADFKSNYYNKNRNILKRLCNQVGVSTSSPVISPKPIPEPRQKLTPKQTSRSTPKPTTPEPTLTDYLLAGGVIIIAIIIIVIAIIYIKSLIYGTT